jgi:hypothetical protein
MHRFFHFVVTDEIAASESVFEWTKRSIGDTEKDPDQGYTETPEHLKDQLLGAFSGVGGSVRTGITVQGCDTFRQ